MGKAAAEPTSGERKKSLDQAISQIKKQYGMGAIMKYGEKVDSNISTILISILSTNTAPVTFDQTLNLEEDSQLAMTLNALDNENDALTIEILNTPLQGVITGSYPNLIYIQGLHIS